jgi:signal transduction histidine kinase
MESPLLEGSDLGEALRKLAAFIASGPLAPTVFVTGTSLQLPRATTHHLLRIAQEATTNAIRHAGARAIELRLDYQPEVVALTITDDGVGFHPEAVLNQAGHFGLRGMRARARKLCGQLSIHSSPGEGTSIHLLVPLTTTIPHVSDAKTEHPHEDPHPACR